MGARVQGFTLHGVFNIPSTSTISVKEGEHEVGDDSENSGNNVKDRGNTIPFKISGSTLVPLLGGGKQDDSEGTSSLELKTGESVTLTFKGVIQQHPDEHGNAKVVTITPIKGNVYSIRLMGEGSQPSQVTAS